MQTVKAGIVGLGYWGPNLLRNFGAQPTCSMVYGCDLEKRNLDKARSFYPSLTYTNNYDDLLSDESLDLVIIATPTTSHFPLAKKALEKGKHVFIEKPMTGSSAEAEELIALAKKQGVKIFVDHTFAFTSSVERMAQLVAEGKLGDLLYFDSTRINLGLIQKDTNVLWDLAIHDLTILGAVIDLAGVTGVLATGSAHYGSHVENAHLHLSFHNSFAAHIHASWLSPVKIRQTILAGTKSMVTYHDTEPSEKLRIYDKGVDIDHTKPDPFFPLYRSGDVVIPSLSSKEALSTEAAHVLDCILNQRQPRVGGEEALRIIRILDAANRSIKEGKAVSIA